MALMEKNPSILDQSADQLKTNPRRSLGSIARECAKALDAGDLRVLNHKESLEAAREMELLMVAAKHEAAKLTKAARQK